MSAAPPASGGTAAASLRVERLCHRFASRAGTVDALRDATLEVREGEFVALLGPSGCGKSTLLRVAAGVLPPQQGEVRVGGAPVRGPDRRVGVAFQKPLLLPWKTVLENVLVPARTVGAPIADATRRARELLATVGLADFERNHPRELSGGMQQRVGLARMLMHDPELLLMDEPFAALDALTRENLMLELQRIWMRTSKSVLFVTHGIAEAVFLADRALVMSPRPGCVVDEVPIDFPRPRTVDTLAAPEFGALCARLRRALLPAA